MQEHVSDEWFKNGSTESGKVEAYYNNWAETYDKTLESWDYGAPKYAADLLQKHSRVEGAICDAGCGTGMTGEALKKAGFASIVGFDLTPGVVEVARGKNIYDEVRVLNMHDRPFPFEDNQFAAVNCIGVLTYVENVPEVLREFVRITKPGGMVVFSHRDDMAAEPEFQARLGRIKEDKLWQEVLVSDPKPYLPGNKDFSDKVNVIYYACRVA